MYRQYLVNQYGIANVDTRQILSANLKALRDRNPKYSSAPAIERATAELGCKIGRSTVQRILDGTTPVNLDFVEVLANLFGMDAWQLLVPNLQPEAPPALRSVSQSEDQLYQKLRRVLEEVKPG